MRNGHRDRPETDGSTDAELFGEQAHSGGELLPPQIRFHTGQQQERRAGSILDGIEVQFGSVVVREMIGLERHRRPTGPVVDQLVYIERCDQLRFQALAQVSRRQLHRVTCVGEALQAVHEDGSDTVVGEDLRCRKLQLVHLRLFGHGLAPFGSTRRYLDARFEPEYADPRLAPCTRRRRTWRITTREEQPTARRSFPDSRSTCRPVSGRSWPAHGSCW